MAKKQTAELRKRVLAKFPKGCKVKHFRHVMQHMEQTTAGVVSSCGTTLAEATAMSLPQALEAILSKGAE